ncbi:amidase domain-containing protein [Kitasatospora sp. RB6PN24]|uniref:amidase domain-containing protein n=1 Tax=Kitasatospora humi TaxID=2893891 RepID=UPI001E42F370|nr:amidase domain-containing protein [Kitasatospora humi]MCC9308287.1 amidase domain-containing protein [Kitasatospora humi]
MLVLAGAATPAPAATVDASGDLLRAAEVDWAEQHWADTAWNDPTPVAFGADQPKYQCAEYVARALAAAGLVPGLRADDSQDSYLHYAAPNGTTYDLLLISDLPPYHTLYDYLMDSRLGTDVGDQPGSARPGDVVVTYAGPDGTRSHTGLVVTAQDGSAEPTVDAHNRARWHYGYHYYAPSHLVRIHPLALSHVFDPEPGAPDVPAPDVWAPQDPSGPQV